MSVPQVQRSYGAGYRGQRSQVWDETSCIKKGLNKLFGIMPPLCVDCVNEVDSRKAINLMLLAFSISQMSFLPWRKSFVRPRCYFASHRSNLDLGRKVKGTFYVYLTLKDNSSVIYKKWSCRRCAKILPDESVADLITSSKTTTSFFSSSKQERRELKANLGPKSDVDRPGNGCDGSESEEAAAGKSGE